MGEIYSKASQVIVWLGKADTDTQLAFDLIKRLTIELVNQWEKGQKVVDESGNEYYPLDLGSADSPGWLAWRKLFGRPWFSRLWVFQEVVLSQTALIVCGEHSAFLQTWITIIQAVSAID